MNYDGPKEYRPLSAWAYFGLRILYSIPLIGFIILIVHAIDTPNINMRSFARSYFCFAITIISIILLIFIFIISVGAGLLNQVADFIKSLII